MLKAIKSNISVVIQKSLMALSPSAYKNRYLKQYMNLSWNNYDENKVEYEMLLLPYFLNADAVFFDVGCNIGSFTLIANKSIAQNQIHAFEPIPELNQRLHKIFPNAHIHSLALSNAKLKTQFKIPKINHTQLLTRGTLNTHFVEANEQGFVKIDVQTNTLDNFVTENNIKKMDVIKIDVEGHEHEVIKGALHSLSAYKPILIIEIEQRHHTIDIATIINDVKQMEYRCFYFDSSTFHLSELSQDPIKLQEKEHFEKSRKYVHNFIFIPTAKVEANYVDSINQRIASDRL